MIVDLGKHKVININGKEHGIQAAEMGFLRRVAGVSLKG